MRNIQTEKAEMIILKQTDNTGFFFLLCIQSEIGFGKIESYSKLDKLGEVSDGCYGN